jgi:hypothetical protein
MEFCYPDNSFQLSSASYYILFLAWPYFLFHFWWQQVSHLLHKYTESGYETVLTAACARQGCSATE